MFFNPTLIANQDVHALKQNSINSLPINLFKLIGTVSVISNDLPVKKFHVQIHSSTLEIFAFTVVKPEITALQLRVNISRVGKVKRKAKVEAAKKIDD